MHKIFLYGILFHGMRLFTGAFVIVYMLSKDLTLADIGWIKAFQAVVMMVLEVPMGYWADKKGYKNSVVLAAFAVSLWLFCTGLAGGFWLFLTAEFFNAVSLTLMGGAYNALLVQAARAENASIAQVLSASSKWNHLGMFAFSLVGASVAEISARGVWFFAAIAMACLCLYGFFGLPHYQIQSAKREPHLSRHHNFKKDWIILKSLWKSYAMFSILFIFCGVFFNVLSQYWQALFGEMDIIITSFQLGLVFSGLLLIQSLSAIVADKCAKQYAMWLMSGLPLITSLIFLGNFHLNLYFMAIVVISWFFVIRLALTLLEIEIHNLLSDELRATYESLLSALMRLLLCGAFPLSAYLITWGGIKILSYLLLLVGVCFVFHNRFLAAKSYTG